MIEYTHSDPAKGTSNFSFALELQGKPNREVALQVETMSGSLFRVSWPPHVDIHYSTICVERDEIP
jgi:hypothetical protein